MSFVELISRYWEILCIPFIAALIGWITNWVAIQMMFYPIEYKGFGRYLGWQGIIPAHANKMASIIVNIITTRLINLEELFKSFAGDSFVKHTHPTIDAIVDYAVEEIAGKHAPAMWQSMNDDVRAQVRAALRKEVEATAIKILDNLSNNVMDIIDIKKTVLAATTRDKALVGRIFQTCGEKELKFIEYSGGYFGFLFGLPLMVVWAFFPSWWLLPVAGFAVGYATNWMALWMVFEPKEPMKFGPWTVQGLFHKRKHEVSEAFAHIVAGEILNANNILALATSGSSGETVARIVQVHVEDLLCRYEKHPVAAMVISTSNIDPQAIRVQVHGRVMQDMKQPGGLLHVFADKAIDIRTELFSRMTQLDPESFEGILRPAFKQDEWKLIVAGGVLGLAAGWVQVVWMFKDMLADFAGK